jgi:hypothetical protein
VPSSTIVAQVSKLASKYSSTTPATASAGVTSSPPAGLWQQVSQTWDHSAKVFALVRFAAPLLLNSVQSTRYFCFRFLKLPFFVDGIALNLLFNFWLSDSGTELHLLAIFKN